MASRALLAAAAAAVLLCCAGTAGAGGSRSVDSYAGVSFHPFTVDSGNDACVAWQVDATTWTRNCDPLNVVFPAQTLAQVEARLSARGWVFGSGSSQRVGFGTPVTWAFQDAQMVYQQDAADRYHVRLWQLPGFVIGGVHHDFGVTTHVIDIPWETSEAFLAAPLCADWCGTVALPDQAAIEGSSGTWRGFANDGAATVIPLAPPPPPTTTAVTAASGSKSGKHRRRHPKP